MLSFFPRDVLDEILNLIESVSEDFPSYSYNVVYLNRSYHSFMTLSAIVTNSFYSKNYDRTEC